MHALRTRDASSDLHGSVRLLRGVKYIYREPILDHGQSKRPELDAKYVWGTKSAEF